MIEVTISTNERVFTYFVPAQKLEKGSQELYVWLYENHADDLALAFIRSKCFPDG